MSKTNACCRKGLAQDKGSKGKGGEKGLGKNSGGKGNGKDNKEKRKRKCGGFQGYCRWLGEWGNSQSRCRSKDKAINEIRRTKGEERNTMTTTRHLSIALSVLYEILRNGGLDL